MARFEVFIGRFLKDRKPIPQEKYRVPPKELEKYTGRVEIRENVTFNIVKDASWSP